jgi:hypothetical protein
MRKIAIIENGYVRDAQIYTGDPADIGDDDLSWEHNFVDLLYPCQYVGVFDGETDDEICKKAAASEGVHPGIISLVAITTRKRIK